MKTSIVKLLATASIALSMGTASAEEDRFAKVQITTEKVSDNLYVLFGSGGNIGLSVGEDGAFLIDDQYAPLTSKILAAIKKVTDSPVTYVINTHWHGDHTGGNENLGKRESVIVAHDHVRDRMSVDQDRGNGRVTKASPKVALPVITFDHQASLHLNGDEARAIYYANAHTDGDSVVFFKKANVVHMGDVMFYKRFPFIDDFSGGTVDGVIAAVTDVITRSDDQTVVIPGHGPVTNLDGLNEYLGLLIKARMRVSNLKDAGKTKDEAIAAKPMADFAKEWNWGFINEDRFVGLVYVTLP
ncbi:MAG: MBL fold metallo-hydrolase [Sphingomonadales bacterium]|nr:MBL fold metallo-hydrolase [Sphingomonadales bacterium]